MAKKPAAKKTELTEEELQAHADHEADAARKAAQGSEENDRARLLAKLDAFKRAVEVCDHRTLQTLDGQVSRAYSNVSSLLSNYRPAPAKTEK